MSKQPVLIITGMHRSGTSLTAALLESAGLDIGQTLLKANYGNPKGYFENVDFLNLHRQILTALNLDENGWIIERDLTVPQAYWTEAKHVIERNASTTQPWGWKEPRTTLFLNFWQQVLPEAKFLFMIRSPWEVLDSLYRRRDKIFYDHPELALKIWLNYNQAISAFSEQFPETSLLVNINGLVQNLDVLIEQLSTKFGIELSTPKVDIYEDSLLSSEVNNTHRPDLVAHFYPEAFHLYYQLNSKAIIADSSALDATDPSRAARSLLQDWAHLKHAQSNYQAGSQQIHQQIQRLEANLAAAQARSQQEADRIAKQQAQLKSLTSTLQNTTSQLHQAEAHSKRLQTQIERYTTQIQQLKSQSQQKRSQLQNLRQVLRQTQDGLDQAQAKISEMENSPFWKLRQTWMNLKAKMRKS